MWEIVSSIWLSLVQYIVFTVVDSNVRILGEEYILDVATAEYFF